MKALTNRLAMGVPRIGHGAGPNGLNLNITRFRDRSDFNPAVMSPNSIVWEIIDVFTTINGSWDPDGSQFSIDQWARDAYLYPMNDPRFNRSGGGDHNIQVCVQDDDGNRVVGAAAVFTSDGPQWLQPAINAERVVSRTTESDGWCNIPIFAPGSRPPIPGPWSASKLAANGAADIITGMGLPWNNHVSTFIVYQARRWSDFAPTYNSLEEALMAEAQANQLIRFNPDAALQKIIFRDGFVPNSNEFVVTYNDVTMICQRAEKLENGVVRCYYVHNGDWNNVRFTEWEPINIED